MCSIKREFLDLKNVIHQRKSSEDETKERMITADTQKKEETEERQSFSKNTPKKSFSERTAIQFE